VALSPGTRLGAYEVAAPLGAGGMGEVYRAVDTRLKRSVAIKVLPDSVANDPDRLARFQREAEILASLSHPNIAAIHGLEESDGINAIVMELVEGRTLAERLAHGPIALDEALPIAKQIAEALEAAHDHGIIHRDLKPANIKVRPDGAVKVLDFGLAKLTEEPALAASSGVASRSLSPTITSPALLTGAGVILGTAAYMSPEQARGRPADKRSDVWAFGVVLFEMLAGCRAFDGEDVSETLALVMTREPAWTALPATTPPALRRLVHRCLQRNPDRRLRDIGDARLELAEAEQEKDAPPIAADAIRSQQPARWWRVLPWSITAGLAAGSLAMLAAWAPWQPQPAAQPLRFEIRSGASEGFAPLGGGLALSPDGSTLAFVTAPPGDPVGVQSSRSLYVRQLASLEATLLSGTEGATFPFFSPDGRWIAFFTGGPGGQLKKVAAGGGAVVALCDAPGARGGSWGDDDTIVFASSTIPAPARLMRIPAAGGQPQPIAPAGAAGNAETWPEVLPGARAVLYTVPGPASAYDTATIFVRPLPNGQPREVQPGGYSPRYLASGHLAFVRNDALFVAPFDIEALQTTGPAVPVIERVTTQTVGTAFVDVSAGGTLVYVAGSFNASAAINQAPVMWLERTGGSRTLRAAPSSWALPRFSPDGERLAMTISDGRQSDIWVYDWMRDILTRVTSDSGNDVSPVWTPDGRRLVFGATRHGPVSNIYVQNADGTGAAERVSESDEPQLPGDFHPDGTRLVLHQGNLTQGRQSIVVLPIERSAQGGLRAGQPSVVVGGPGLKAYGRFSPDGRWLAYVSQESGRFEVYVQPFPGPGPRVQISSDGSSKGLWSPTRPELYFAGGAAQAQMMMIRYSVEGEVFKPGRASASSETRFSGAPPFQTYGPGFDIHPDGERFAVAPAVAAPTVGPQTSLTIVLNFFSELQRLAPAAW
jgi:eukaryotic-like serine/threonine-protein kinase